MLWISQRRPRSDEGLKECPKVVFPLTIDDEDSGRCSRQLLRPVRAARRRTPKRYGSPAASAQSLNQARVRQERIWDEAQPVCGPRSCPSYRVLVGVLRHKVGAASLAA